MKTIFKGNRGVAGALALAAVSLAIGASAMAALLPEKPREDAPSASQERIADALQSRRLPVDDFRGVRVAIPMSVVYVQGEFPGYVEVVGHPFGAERVKAAVEEGILTLDYDFSSLTGGAVDIPMVRVCSPRLEEVELSQAASLSTENVCVVDTLRVMASGAASVNFGEISGNMLRVEASGASSVYALAVDVGDVVVNAQSASNVRLKGLNAGMVTASAMSMAQLTLGGRCDFSNISTSGGGKVNSRGLIDEGKSSRPERKGAAAVPVQQP